MDLWRKRDLVWRIALRDFQARYRNSVLGVVWAVILPIATMLIYALVFSVIFQAKWGTGSENASSYPFFLIILSGFMLFNLVVDPLTTAPNLIVSNSTYVKKILFPLHALPAASVTTTLLNTLIFVALFFLVFVVTSGVPPLTSLALPLAFVPVLFVAIGLAYFLSSLGVFLRDIAQATPFLGTALLFLSPIFFPLDTVPEEFRPLLLFNPLTYPVNVARDLLFEGRLPEPIFWSLYTAATAAFAAAGYFWFLRTRKAFADVL